eukprot:CAMPEP_0177711522 /NCGR_PEP_ID=MMETSP0484_2-20121128/11907_1 /TAXON_ID=354590 /ORGANISM="Rhodomonas lens, Strain RHODO" /LENGTH=186 /DNA_ID=CAMNT_0019223263 /DNA_START=21 /DNA_END=581 /DNA_ORIENTATION=-
MASRTPLLLALCLAVLAFADAFLPGMFAPALRPASARAGVTSICMGRKGAQTGQGGGNTRTVTRDRKKKAASGVSVVKVKKVKGDVTRAMILEKLDTATKDNFASEILSDQIEKFMKEEAGSSMYPRLMKKIKAKATFLGTSVPDRWAYEAMANKYQRQKLAEKIQAANAPAEGEGEEAAEEAPAA